MLNLLLIYYSNFKSTNTSLKIFIGTVRILNWAVPQFKWLVAEIPHRSRGYKASLVHVRFVLEDVIPGYVVSGGPVTFIPHTHLPITETVRY